MYMCVCVCVYMYIITVGDTKYNNIWSLISVYLQWLGVRKISKSQEETIDLDLIFS